MKIANSTLSACLLLSLCVTSAFASWNPPTHTWGGSSTDFGEGSATDSTGNVYAVGATNSYGAGGSDALILKYDPSGNLLWSKTWGGGGNDVAYAVGVGPDGLVYVTGGTASYGAGWY